MKPILTLFIFRIFLGFSALVGQKASAQLDQLFLRIQNAEAQLINLRKPDSISSENATSKEKLSGERGVPGKDRVDLPLKPNKQVRPITGVGLVATPQSIRQGESKFDQLLEQINSVEAKISNQLKVLRKPEFNPSENEIIEENILPDVILPDNIPPTPPIPKEVKRRSKLDQLLDRINAAEGKISRLQEPQIQVDVPDLPEPDWGDSVPTSSPQINENPPPSPSPTPIPFVSLPEGQKEQELPLDSSVNNRAGQAQEFSSREPNEVRLRLAYIFPFESNYIQPTTATSLPLSYDSGRQLALEYLFGSELISLGTSVLWSESKHREIGPVSPLGTFPAHGRTRSFGGSLLARLSKDINMISFEALLSLGLARRLDEFRFDTGYFSEAGLSFLHSLDLGMHYRIFEDHKVGIYWRYQNLAGLNHNSENKNAQLGLSYAREF